MRKLKLESLQVDSFDTTAAASGLRGTVPAHAEAITGTRCPTYDPCQPSYDPHNCPYTEFMDCTYGCTRLYNTCGGNYCWIEKTADCTS